MKKTLNITIGGRVFAIEEDAFDRLNTYLEQIKTIFKTYPDPEEIIADMEDRLADQFQSMHENSANNLITLANVEGVIAIMGTPEDLEHETTSDEQVTTSHKDKETDGPRRLYRNSDDKIIFGVCSGVAAYFNINSLWIRVAFIVFSLLPLPVPFLSGVLLYVILAIIIPEAKSTTEKMEMRGKPITIAGIVDTMKQEFTDEKNKERVEKVKAFTHDAADSVVKVYEREKPRVESVFIRIIRFPFELIVNTLRFLKNKILPLIIRITGLFATLFSLAFSFGIVAGLFFALFNRNTPNVHWPFPELLGTIPYHLVLFSLFVVLIIPCLLVFLLGITMVRYKNSFNRAFTLTLVGSWIVVGIVGGSTLAAIMPEILQKAPENEYFKTVSQEYKIKDFDTIVVSGYYNYTIHQGKEFKVEVHGRKPYFDQLKIEKGANNILHIEDKNHRMTCFGWCYGKEEVTFDITLPELKNIEAHRGALVIVKPRTEKNIAAASDYHAMIKFDELKVKSFTASLTNNGRIRASGTGETAEVTMEGGEFYGENFQVKNMNLKNEYSGKAHVNATNDLTIKGRENTWVYYKNNPKVTCEVGGDSVVEPYDDYLAFHEKMQSEEYTYKLYTQLSESRLASTKNRCTISSLKSIK